MADAPESVMRGRPKVPLDAEEPAIDGVRRVLLALIETVEAHVPGTLADADPEYLHELRVAVRRSRSVLRAAQGVIPKDIRRARRNDFAWLGSVTGPPRDLDVLVLGWPADVEMIDDRFRTELEPVYADLAHARWLAHEHLDNELRSSRFVDLVGGWSTWLKSGRGSSSTALGPVVAKRVQRAYDTVVSSGHAITDATPAEDLHELRKQAKQLRYLLECFGGLFPKAPRREFVGALKQLQDNLGEHQDAEVHLTTLQDLDSPSATAGITALTAVLDARRQAARDEFSVRFATFDTDEVAASLATMVQPLR